MRFKVFVLLATLLLVITPNVVSARRSRRPAPPPTQTPITTKVYGVNYGHNFAGHTYDATLASADLDELKADGVKSVRIYMPSPNTSEVAFTQSLAVLAKSKGFIVIWGVCTGGSVSTTTQWNKYLSTLDSYAAWANSKSIDYFSLGNEEEFIPISKSTIQNGIRNKASSLKLKYPSLKLTYAAAAEPSWISAWTNTGSLDTVGFNLYVAFADLTDQIKQNPKAIVTEWNTDGGIDAVNGSESQWATELVNARDDINSRGVKSYLFVTRGNGGGIDDNYSLWIGSTRRPAWQALLQ